MALPEEFQPRLQDSYPRLENQWIPPRIRLGENKTFGGEGKLRLHRETKREFVRRMCAQVTALAGAFYDDLKERHFVANPIHARNDFLRYLHDQGQSYECIRLNEPEASCLSREGVRKAINESRKRTGVYLRGEAGT
jgi:hypothetical protein